MRHDISQIAIRETLASVWVLLFLSWVTCSGGSPLPYCENLASSGKVQGPCQQPVRNEEFLQVRFPPRTNHSAPSNLGTQFWPSTGPRVGRISPCSEKYAEPTCPGRARAHTHPHSPPAGCLPAPITGTAFSMEGNRPEAVGTNWPISPCGSQALAKAKLSRVFSWSSRSPVSLLCLQEQHARLPG